MFKVMNYAEPIFSESDGAGAGGGERYIVSAKLTKKDSTSVIMEIRAQKYPGDPEPIFENRPYQARVSGPGTDPCGPDAFYFVINNTMPNGVGTGELVFTFESNWLPDQTEKYFCVTASMDPDDPGYDEKAPVQQSWWWSDKILVTRSCE